MTCEFFYDYDVKNAIKNATRSRMLLPRSEKMCNLEIDFHHNPSEVSVILKIAYFPGFHNLMQFGESPAPGATP